MAENVVVHFDDRGERALAKAGDGAHRELAVGGGECNFVGLAARSDFVSLSPRSRQTFASRSREPRVWQAVPRQTQITLSPCGSRLKSA